MFRRWFCHRGCQHYGPCVWGPLICLLASSAQIAAFATHGRQIWKASTAVACVTPIVWEPSTSWLSATTPSTSAFIDIHYFWKVAPLVPSAPIQKSLIPGPSNFCHISYFAPLQSLLRLINAHTARCSRVHWWVIFEVRSRRTRMWHLSRLLILRLLAGGNLLTSSICGDLLMAVKFFLMNTSSYSTDFPAAVIFFQRPSLAVCICFRGGGYQDAFVARRTSFPCVAVIFFVGVAVILLSAPRLLKTSVSTMPTNVWESC